MAVAARVPRQKMGPPDGLWLCAFEVMDLDVPSDIFYTFPSLVCAEVPGCVTLQL